jgi:hypothetical protein
LAVIRLFLQRFDGNWLFGNSERPSDLVLADDFFGYAEAENCQVGLASVRISLLSISCMKPHVVFVDVDDTLVRSVGSKRIPMTGVVAEILALHGQGAVLYLWSSGGAEYARASAVELQIEHCFAGFLPKPDVIVDDQPFTAWRNLRHVYPLQASSAKREG